MTRPEVGGGRNPDGLPLGLSFCKKAWRQLPGYKTRGSPTLVPHPPNCSVDPKNARNKATRRGEGGVRPGPRLQSEGAQGTHGDRAGFAPPPLLCIVSGKETSAISDLSTLRR